MYYFLDKYELEYIHSAVLINTQLKIANDLETYVSRLRNVQPRK